MAKKQLGDLVSGQPQPAPTPPEDLGLSRAVGIGLREGEWAQFEQIASELGLSRNAVAAWALRHFLKLYQAGEIDLPVETEVKHTLGGP